MEVGTMLFAIMVLLLVAIYVQLSRMIYEVRNLNTVIKEISEHIMGDVNNPDFREIRPSIKELIVNRCCGIQKEIAKIRCGLFGGDGNKTNAPDTADETRAATKNQA